MKVLDLFAGLGGWSAAFTDRGHDVTHVELDPRFEPDICADVFDLTVDDFLVVHRDTKPSLIDTDCEAEVDELVEAIIEAAVQRTIELAHMRGAES